MAVLPPAPIDAPFASYNWVDWYEKVRREINEATNIDLASQVTGILPIANGGSGTSTPSLVAGSNIGITGSWPNQTVATVGISAVIATAKLTGGGVNGSMTFVNGILTAQTAAT